MTTDWERIKADQARVKMYDAVTRLAETVTDVVLAAVAPAVVDEEYAEEEPECSCTLRLIGLGPCPVHGQ